MTGIAVIIPFFARGPAVLARTVRTVLGQCDVPTPLVIVVDDGSPRPAAAELASLEAHEMAHVRLIKQPNGGPALAKNAALDAVPDDTEWIALLDADDTWAPDHLARAVSGLARGYDFYFCNHERIDVGIPHYTCCGFDPLQHPLLENTATLHQFEGDFFALNLNLTPVGTSTVVYRRSTLGSLRFPTFPWAWEDLMFWLDVASQTRKVLFDAEVRVVYDPSGIAGVGGWRSLAELQRKLWYIQHFSNVRGRFRLTERQAAIVDDTLEQHTQGFAVTFLALLRHGILPRGRIVRDFVRWRPQVIPTLCVVAGQQVTRQLAGRVSPYKAASSASTDRADPQQSQLSDRADGGVP